MCKALFLVYLFDILFVCCLSIRQRYDKSNANSELEKQIFSDGISNEYLRSIKKRNAYNEDPCVKYGTCSYNKYKTVPSCMCDVNCHIFNDCCLDAIEEPPMNFVQNETQFQIQMREYMECRISNNNAIPRGFLMVNKCPSDFQNLYIKHRCEFHGQKDVPVTGENTFISYWNEFCALCHNDKQYVNWDLHVADCNKVPLIHVISNNTVNDLPGLLLKKCLFSFLPPENTLFVPRSCTIDIQNNVSKENEKCVKYVNPVLACASSGNCRIYRNIFCLDEMDPQKVDARCIGPMEKSFNPKSLTIMFTFDSNNRNNHLTGCESNLKSIVCNTTTEDTAITVKSVTLRNVKFRATYQMEFTNSEDKTFFKRGVFLFCYHCLRLDKSSLNVTTIYAIEYCLSENLEKCFLFLDIQYSLLLQMPLDEYNTYYKRLNSMRWSYIEKSENSTMNYTVGTTIVHNVNSWHHKQMLFQYGPRSIDIDSVYSSSFTIESNQNRFTSREVPDMCEISATINTKGRVMILNVILEDFKEADKITNQTQTKRTSSSLYDLFTDPKIILTYFTMSISIIFLLGILFVFKFLTLRAGSSTCITINITVILLFAHILFLFGSGLTDYPVPCSIIGSLSHYCWLSFFIWLNIFVMFITSKINSIWKFLGPEKSGSSIVQNKGLNYYYVIGYCTPLIAVIPSVIVDFSRLKDVQVIDISITCFPNTYPFNLVVFVIPVFLSVIFNIVCLCFSGISIYRIKSIKLHSSIQTNRAYLSMFVKLCSISGFSWCFGIFAEIFKSVTLDYIFITLSGLHGFIFSLCFLSSKQLRDNIYKKKLGKDVEEMSLHPLNNTPPLEITVIRNATCIAEGTNAKKSSRNNSETSDFNDINAEINHPNLNCDDVKSTQNKEIAIYEKYFAPEFLTNSNTCVSCHATTAVDIHQSLTINMTSNQQLVELENLQNQIIKITSANILQNKTVIVMKENIISVNKKSIKIL